MKDFTLSSETRSIYELVIQLLCGDADIVLVSIDGNANKVADSLASYLLSRGWSPATKQVTRDATMYYVIVMGQDTIEVINKTAITKEFSGKYNRDLWIEFYSDFDIGGGQCKP